MHLTVPLQQAARGARARKRECARARPAGRHREAAFPGTATRSDGSGRHQERWQRLALGHICARPCTHTRKKNIFIIIIYYMVCRILCRILCRFLCRGMAANPLWQGFSLCRNLCCNLCRFLCRFLGIYWPNLARWADCSEQRARGTAGRLHQGPPLGGSSPAAASGRQHQGGSMGGGSIRKAAKTVCGHR